MFDEVYKNPLRSGQITKFILQTVVHKMGSKLMDSKISLTIVQGTVPALLLEKMAHRNFLE